jgi:hypothetical protein
MSDGGKWGTDWLMQNCADEVLGDCPLNTEPSGVHTVQTVTKPAKNRYAVRVGRPLESGLGCCAAEFGRPCANSGLMQCSKKLPP